MRAIFVIGLIAAGGIVASAGAKRQAASPSSPSKNDARQLYNRYCLACHGQAGDGNGPATPWLYPRPRDFTSGRYKWRTTKSGQPPLDSDLVRIISEGAPGTMMPGYRGILSQSQIDALVPLIKAFAAKRFAKRPVAVKRPPAPTVNDALVKKGRRLYSTFGCQSCHGTSGKGDGSASRFLKDASGRPAPPFDLTAEPLRRGQRGLADIFTTLTTGIDGSGMPAFSPAVSNADLWAIAAYIDSIRYRGPMIDFRKRIPALAIQAVTGQRSGLSIAPQGKPPNSLPPAARSLSSQQCGRCHAKQLREWTGSIHATAMSPGTVGQFHQAGSSFVASCQRCHAPLAEQRPGQQNYDHALRKESITCAACHVRGHVRHGPQPKPQSGLLGIATYPFVQDDRYERSDFCLPCHQLPASSSLAGRPLLDTYREWLKSPYMRRGVQCQHCHMPNREHQWKGVHDPDTVRQGLSMSVWAKKVGTRLRARVRLTNVGAGHYLPTTPTPAAHIIIEPLDKRGRSLAKQTKRIGRKIRFNRKWEELEDTRIPPGESIDFAPQFSASVAKKTHRVRVTVTMHPDDYYEGFYRRYLRRKNLKPAGRRLITQALARASKSTFVVFARTYPVK